MLGRTANGLFWMFRYLERAENTARLLDAGLRMALTRDIVTAEEEWRSVIATAGLASGYERKHATYTGVQAWNYMLRDKANPASVLAMLGQVRQNARLARGEISTEVWTAVNESWLDLKDRMAKPISEQKVGELIEAVRRTGTLVHGAVQGTMLRDEAYHFARTGTFIERGESTARILDIKYYLLLPSLSYVGTSLDTGQWDQILRSVSGDQAYRRLFAGPIDARRICELLVLDERFPRSLAFCHNQVRENLAALARIHGHEGDCHALMREADMRLADLTVAGVFEQGLHEFLAEFTDANAAIADAIGVDYRFLV